METLMGFCSNYVLIKIYLVDWVPGRLNTMLPYMDAVCLQSPLAKTNTLLTTAVYLRLSEHTVQPIA